MNEGESETPLSRSSAIALWQALLRDEVALLNHPGAHHKALLSQAHSLHREQVINRDDLSDLLEQADSALAYAVEALIHRDVDDQAG
jgi:predicted metal-dependent hydrolase